MPKCPGITHAGSACRGIPIGGSPYCYAHHPDHDQERRRHGARGGKRGGRGRPVVELASLRNENADIRRRLLGDELAPNVAAVAVQSLNTDARLIVAALKAREQEELEERLADLERLLGRNDEEGARWG